MGDDVQTGINSAVDVGTIIGNKVFIGLGAMAKGEIKPYAKIL
jgi:acetyltransferase-like isoleucine patch superfamily enzyme